jgi:multicomponent Na+:H+ antiporter subunit D
MSLLLLHPALAYVIGFMLVMVLPERIRWIALVGTPIAGLVMVEMLAASSAAPGSLQYLGETLQPLRIDALSLIFARIFAIAGGIAMLFGLHERSKLTHAAAMLTVAGGLGVVLAGDLLSLFVFWEIKALATAAVVFGGGMAHSLRASQRYLLIHTAGGAILLVGIAAWASQHGLAFDAMTLNASTAWILVAFGLNAAIPPLHAWMTDAYPEGSPFGTVLLSAFTTKAAVYALVRGFPGTEPLMWIGAAMALYGAILAMLQNDIRRLLAYHIVSQVGFMVCGVGMGVGVGVIPGIDPAADKVGYLALNGTTAHAFSHILYKGLLLMSTGAVIYATGLRKLSDLGGLWRHMPLTLVLCLIGGFSISGTPLWNGFVSKSMVISAATYGHFSAVEWMLVGASIGTFLSTTLKLPWFIFFAADQGVRPQRKLPWNMTAAMIIAAVLCTLIGVAPTLLYDMLPNPGKYEPFTVPHVVDSMQILLGTALAFFLLLPLLTPKDKITREAGALYRGAGLGTVWFSRRLLVPTMQAFSDGVQGGVRRLPEMGPRIAAAVRAPVGFWVMIAVAVLAVLVFALGR